MNPADFDCAMREIYDRAKKECNYPAARFLQMVEELGGVEAAKRLIRQTTAGFTRLWEEHRLDLTVEAYVLKPEFRQLFTEEELALAKSRLEEAGYRVPGEPSKESVSTANRIVVDPAICHGKPTIRGTRIMVVNILSMLAGGASFDDIRAAYPQLSRQDIQAAVEYAAQVVADEEVRFLETAG